MENRIKKLSPGTRWEIVFKDNGAWRAGVYKPEYGRAENIEILEKHSCPELFICMNGRMGLLIFDGKIEHTVEFMPGEALLVDDYHNGYFIDGAGFFTVIERTSFSTEYIDRATGKIIKTVHT